MKDKAGQVYLALGAFLAGAGGSTFLAGLFTSFSPWGLGIAGFLTIVGLYMLLAVLLDWRLPGRKSSLVLIIENARELSASIATWIGDRRRTEPHFSNEQWDASVERSMRHSTETMIHWNERYGVKALTAYDQLVAHGADTETSRWGGRSVFEHPTNPLGIEEAGRTLGVMAAHLEKKTLIRG